jgi:hypothetical protein
VHFASAVRALHFSNFFRHNLWCYYDNICINLFVPLTISEALA